MFSLVTNPSLCLFFLDLVRVEWAQEIGWIFIKTLGVFAIDRLCFDTDMD